MAAGGVGQAERGPQTLVWRAWPAAERPPQAVLVALAIVAAAFALGIYGGSPIIGGVALAILFLSLAAYFLPTTFRIDEEGVAASSVLGARRRDWSALRTYVADARGVTLSPYRRPSWLESYRGIRLLFAGNRDEVVAAVAAHLAPLPPSRPRSESAHD